MFLQLSAPIGEMSVEVNSPHGLNQILTETLVSQNQYFENKPRSRRPQPRCFEYNNTKPANDVDLGCYIIKAIYIEKKCINQLRCQNRKCNSLKTATHTLLNSLEDEIEKKEAENKIKHYKLYKKWDESVYRPIKEAIRSNLESREYKIYDKKKRKLFSRYLLTGNVKGHVFLDQINKREYDPFLCRNHRFTAPVNSARDPLRINDNEEKISKSIEDNLMAGQKEETKKRDEKRRDGGPRFMEQNEHQLPVFWSRMNMTQINSPYRTRSRKIRQFDKMVCSSDFPDVPFTPVRLPMPSSVKKTSGLTR